MTAQQAIYSLHYRLKTAYKINLKLIISYRVLPLVQVQNPAQTMLDRASFQELFKTPMLLRYKLVNAVHLVTLVKWPERLVRNWGSDSNKQLLVRLLLYRQINLSQVCAKPEALPELKLQIKSVKSMQTVLLNKRNNRSCLGLRLISMLLKRAWRRQYQFSKCSFSSGSQMGMTGSVLGGAASGIAAGLLLAAKKRRYG